MNIPVHDAPAAERLFDPDQEDLISRKPRSGEVVEDALVRKRHSIEGTRHEELRRALRLLQRGEDPARILDELSRRLTNKLLHAPTSALHEALSPGRQR